MECHDNNCGSNSTCQSNNNNGTFSCICNNGFTGDGINCTDMFLI